MNKQPILLFGLGVVTSTIGIYMIKGLPESLIYFGVMSIITSVITILFEVFE